VQNELYQAQKTSWEATQKFQEKSQKFYDNVVDALHPTEIKTRNPKTRQSHHGPCRKMMKKVVQLLTNQTKDHHLHCFKCEFDKVIEEANNDLLLPTKTVETRHLLIHIGQTLCAYGEQLNDFVPTTEAKPPKACHYHSKCSVKPNYEHVHEFAATTFVDSKLDDDKIPTNEEMEFEQLLHQVDELNNPVFWNDNMKPCLSHVILSSEVDNDLSNFSFLSNEFEDSFLFSDEEPHVLQHPSTSDNNSDTANDDVVQHCFISFDQTSEQSDNDDLINEVTNDQQDLPPLEQIVEGGRENDDENLSDNLSSNLSAVSEEVIEDLDYIEQQFNNELLIEPMNHQQESHQSEREMISFDSKDYPFRSDESYALIEMTWTQFEQYIKEFM
jgi:hypothetical protein